MAEQTQHQADFMAGRDLACELFEKAMEFDCTDKAELSSQYRAGAAQAEFVTPFLEALRNKPELAGGFAAALSCGLVHGVGCIDTDNIAAVTYQQIFGPYAWPEDDGELASNVVPFKPLLRK